MHDNPSVAAVLSISTDERNLFRFANEKRVVFENSCPSLLSVSDIASRATPRLVEYQESKAKPGKLSCGLLGEPRLFGVVLGAPL